MNKCFILTFFFLSFLLPSCSADDVNSKLNGTWSNSQSLNLDSSWVTQKEFSWGTGYQVINDSYDFDLDASTPYIQIGGLGVFEILEVNIFGDNVQLIFFFGRGGFNVEYILHFVEPNVFWIENRTPELEWDTKGDSRLFYKNSGPNPYVPKE